MAEAVNKALTEYSHATAAIVNLLGSGAKLSPTERLHLENNLTIVQLRYLEWLRETKSQTKK